MSVLLPSLYEENVTFYLDVEALQSLLVLSFLATLGSRLFNLEKESITNLWN